VPELNLAAFEEAPIVVAAAAEEPKAISEHVSE